MWSFRKKKLTIATTVYWLWLLYIIAALVWWFIALQNQNEETTRQRLEEIKPATAGYTQRINTINQEKKTKTAQYIGEGAIFLALILVGAVFVYRSVRRQIQLQVQQQNFMMAITHELKTPIAITKLNLETLLKHQLDETTRQKLVSSTLQEANRLNNLAENILVSAQLEDHNYKPSKEEIDFSSLVMNCVENFSNRYPEKKFVPDIQPEVDLMGDVLLLQILVNNLLDNAVKYAPTANIIICRLKKEREIFLHIIDEGSGIPDHEKKHVFRKFYRVGSEQTRQAKGTGLGLYLCRKIANDHHAEIRVKDNHPSGSDFAVIFAVES